MNGFKNTELYLYVAFTLFQGFYSVYRQVFEVLANEEYEFATDTEVKYPGFGDSGSDYETV